MTGKAPAARRARPAAKRRLPLNGGRPRAERGVRTALGYAFFVGVFLLIAHASGSGWVQAVAALVAGVLALGGVAPLVATRRAVVRCVDSPTDAIAGEVFRLSLTCPAAVRVTPLSPGGDVQLLTAGVAISAPVRAARRGVVEAVDLLVSSSFPFGLLWWTKAVRVELPVAVHVAPRVGLALDPPVEAIVSTEDPGTAVRPSYTGDLRSLRPYRSGDARRRVHWPATAHTRELVVREDEDRDPRPPVVVRAVLPADDDAAERLAERLLATVLALLDASVPCVLETDEAGGRRIRRFVGGPADARRRLARAIPFDSGAGGSGVGRSGAGRLSTGGSVAPGAGSPLRARTHRAGRSLR